MIADNHYHYETDFERIKIQAELAYNSDKKVIDRAITSLKQIKKSAVLKILDFGCGDGLLTFSRFNQYKNIVVHGYDKNQSCIQKANSQYLSGDFHFFNFDINDDNFPKDEKFDLIFSANTLHHLDRPMQSLQRLWNMLDTYSALIIRTPDDRSKVFHPQSKALDILINEYNRISKSNRYYGNQLYGDLLKLHPNPKTIKVFYHIDTNVNAGKSKKKKLFEDLFRFRINSMKGLNLLSGDDEHEIGIFQKEFTGSNRIYFHSLQYTFLTFKPQKQ